MKYAQLLIGLVVGTALGGSVVASTGKAPISSDAQSPDAIKAIVRDVISSEPQLILDSVQKYQQDMMKKQQESNNAVLKDPAVKDKIFADTNSAFIGPKDAKKVVVQFFDYDCPACKMMHKTIESVVAKDKEVKFVFREYPIFGEGSDFNSRIGLAIWRTSPEKYYDFYVKMMETTGQKSNKEKTLALVKSLGLNVDKIKEEAEKQEVKDIIADSHQLGQKLNVQGTPTLVIGDEIVPHALSPEDLEQRLNAPAENKAEPDDKKADVKPAAADDAAAKAPPAKE